MSIILLPLCALLTFLSSVVPVTAAQFRNEFATVDAVNRDYPGLITSGHPCGAFVDQVAHRLNRHDGEVRWGRKARQADGGNPNCDGLAYLNDPNDRAKKTLVDIIINSPDPGRDDPNARPAWQEFPGDNLGNGYWLAPQVADLDSAPAPPPVSPPPAASTVDQKLDALIVDLAATHAAVDGVRASLEEHRRVSRSLYDRAIAFFKNPVTISTIVGILTGKFIVPGGK